MDKKLILLMSIFIISFILFISFVLLGKNEIMNGVLTKAASNLQVSPKTSLILAYPLLLPPDGKSKAEINVFVRNENPDKEPVAIPGKKVKIITTLGKVVPEEVKTNTSGQAVFNLTSETAGIAQIQAVIDDNITLNQKISVEFK